MKRPTFLYIGADKSGSTWISEVLRRHPRCYVPPCKDLYFFDRFYDRGLEWYLSFFKNAPASATAVGELSHDYLYSAEAAARIARDLPEVKLVACLRQPTERAFSEYLHVVRSGLTRKPFAQAVADLPGILDHSRYARHLREYLQRFDRSRIKVLFFDLLQKDPTAFARELFGFLGLEVPPDLPYSERVLPASRPRSYLLARAAKQGAELARQMGLVNLVGVVKRSRLTALLYQPYAPDERPRLGPAERTSMDEQFRPDVEALEDMLGVDLRHWRRPEGGGR